MKLSQYPQVRLFYLVPFAVMAAVSAWLALPWWGISVLMGCVLVIWDWLWGLDWLKDSSTAWFAVAAGALGLIVSYLLAWQLGLGLDEFVNLSRSAPRRAGWIYWLPGFSLGAVFYGLFLRVLQATSRR